MNLSFPRLNLSILEPKIKNMNNSFNNCKINKNRSFQKSSDIKKKFNLNALTKKYNNKNISIQFYQKNAVNRNPNIFNNKIKQIRLIKSNYFHNDFIQKKVDSPLKREYKKLLSNLPNNKRCFINLHNENLDSIFKLQIPNSNFKRSNNQRKIIKKNRKDTSVNTNKSTIFPKKKICRIPFEPKLKIHYKISSNSCKNNTQNISLNKINKNCFNLSINKDLPSPVYKCKSNINKVKYLYLMLKLSTPSKIKLNLLNGINNEEFKIKDSISSFISKYNNNKKKLKIKYVK